MPHIDVSAFMGSTLPSPVQVDSASYRVRPIVQKDIGRTGTFVEIEGEGFFQGDDAASFATTLNALVSYSLVSGQNFRILGIGGAVVHEMLAAKFIEGGPHIELHVLEEGSAAFYRRIRFRAEGKTISDLPISSYKLKTAVGQDRLRRVTQSGTLIGIGSDAIFSGSILPSFQASYPLPNWMVSYEIDHPSAGVGLGWSQLVSTYSITAVELASPLPQGGGAIVVEGEATVRSERDEQMRLLTVFEFDVVMSSGNFRSLLDSLRPDTSVNVITHESATTTSVRQLRLRCSFHVLAGGDGNPLLNRTETLAITKAQDVYEEFKYAGADPIAVRKPKSLTRVSQSGSATGLKAFPKEPAPVLDTHEEEPQIRFADTSNYEKQTSWMYAMMKIDDGDLDIPALLSQIARPANPEFY